MRYVPLLSIASVLAVQLCFSSKVKNCANAISSPCDDNSFLHRRSTDKKAGCKRPTLWSSMLTVSPSNIISTLIERGGLFIPKSIEQEIKILRSVIHCETSEMNLLDRHLILYNVTVGLPDELTALRIGRVYIYWDSFLRPCMDIEVDDVDILVEFTNLMLTLNNWNELQDFGFPPDVSNYYDAESKQTSSFVRFNSIYLSRNMTVRVQSRPLNRDMGTFAMDMDVTDDLNAMIGNLSDFNLEQTGRKGCSSTELANLLQSFFNKKVRHFISNTLNDIATNPTLAMQTADRFFNQASEKILGYATHVGQKTGENIEGIIVTRLDKLGLDSPSDKVAFWKKQSLDILNRRKAINIRNIDRRDNNSPEEDTDLSKGSSRVNGANKPSPDL